MRGELTVMWNIKYSSYDSNDVLFCNSCTYPEEFPLYRYRDCCSK